MKIKGVVVYQDLEGGFWGIKSDDGRRFVPVNPLPERMKKDGTPITATVTPVQVLSALQWGEHVQIEDIESTR